MEVVILVHQIITGIRNILIEHYVSLFTDPKYIKLNLARKYIKNSIYDENWIFKGNFDNIVKTIINHIKSKNCDMDVLGGLFNYCYNPSLIYPFSVAGLHTIYDAPKNCDNYIVNSRGALFINRPTLSLVDGNKTIETAWDFLTEYMFQLVKIYEENYANIPKNKNEARWWYLKPTRPEKHKLTELLNLVDKKSQDLLIGVVCKSFFCYNNKYPVVNKYYQIVPPVMPTDKNYRGFQKAFDDGMDKIMITVYKSLWGEFEIPTDIAEYRAGKVLTRRFEELPEEKEKEHNDNTTDNIP